MTPRQLPPRSPWGAVSTPDPEQTRRLRVLVELVRERNPFQRARLADVDAAAPDLLAALPPLTKRELVSDQGSHPPFGTNLTYPIERYTHMHQTSGPTGRPLRVLDTAEDWAGGRSA